jgi:catechol 2,3-dioxygenase-like lactoylglutathione lyase family enzyme
MRLLSAIPALPVRDVPAAVAFYQERLGFEMVHLDGGFGIVRRDDVVIHLWEANDPATPGAEPHLAGSASCRVRVEHLGALYAAYQSAGVVHPNGPLYSQPWGDDDFTILDLDGNAIGFFAPTAG